MALDVSDVLGITNNFQKVLISDEVETSIGRTLCFQIVTKSFLNFSEQIAQSFQCLLQALDVHDISQQRLSGYFFHQRCEF